MNVTMRHVSVTIVALQKQ